MKIARFTTDGGATARLAIVDEHALMNEHGLTNEHGRGGRVTLADLGSDTTVPDDVGALLSAGFDAAAQNQLADRAAAAPTVTIDRSQLLSPIARPPEFLAIGLNYRAHVAEGGRPDPTTPVVFNKQATCITGPHSPIHIPAAAPDLVDYEGELGVVIGRTCRHVPAERAAEVIAGYVVVNDVSVRDWQRASPTMTMGKSWDTHGPVGPWLVTADEVDDPMSLDLVTVVDGEERQRSNTSQMIFDIPTLIEHLSTAFTLLPGTIIATGTPEGVGVFREPRAMLQPGGQVSVTIEGVGGIDNPVIDEPSPTTRID